MLHEIDVVRSNKAAQKLGVQARAAVDQAAVAVADKSVSAFRSAAKLSADVALGAIDRASVVSQQALLGARVAGHFVAAFARSFAHRDNVGAWRETASAKKA